MMTKPQNEMRIAIASAHLGGVCRGVEGWSKDLAYGLRDRGISVTLFKGDGKPDSAIEEVLPSFPVSGGTNRRILALLPPGSWRLGLANAFELAQRSFGFSLLWRLGRHFDIIHTKDAGVAGLTHFGRRHGLIRAATVFANGTGAPWEFLSKLDFVQALTHQQQTEAIERSVATPTWRLIPNFVNPRMFKPLDRRRARAQWGFRPDARIVLTVGALDHSMKRLDFLIRAFAALVTRPSMADVHLVVAGHVSGNAEKAPVVQLGRSLLGSRIRFLPNVSREAIPSLYPCADLFTLCSLQEPFGTVLLEAAFCGIPCLTAPTESFKWILGPHGLHTDMESESTLAASLEQLLGNAGMLAVRAAGQQVHCLNNFSQDNVLTATIEYYRSVIAATRPLASRAAASWNSRGPV